MRDSTRNLLEARRQVMHDVLNEMEEVEKLLKPLEERLSQLNVRLRSLRTIYCPDCDRKVGAYSHDDLECQSNKLERVTKVLSQ